MKDLHSGSAAQVAIVEHDVLYDVILESMESFVRALVLHKHSCKAGTFVELGPSLSVGPAEWGYRCENPDQKCDRVWKINTQKLPLLDSNWRYIRGGDKTIFEEFIRNVHATKHTGGTYEDLFVAYLVMCS